jgi:hypothetical protein
VSVTIGQVIWGNTKRLLWVFGEDQSVVSTIVWNAGLNSLFQVLLNLRSQEIGIEPHTLFRSRSESVSSISPAETFKVSVLSLTESELPVRIGRSSIVFSVRLFYAEMIHCTSVELSQQHSNPAHPFISMMIFHDFSESTNRSLSNGRVT